MNLWDQSIDVEQSWVLTGTRLGRVWVGRRRWESQGEPSSVGFPWPKVIRRHNARRDVVGFAHTHPHMPASPSYTDVMTMQAWVMTLGRPLLCVIGGTDGLRGFVFADDDSIGVEIENVDDVDGIIVGVEYGKSAGARDGISRPELDAETVQV